MGAVPVVLDSNPYAVGFDESGGSVAVGSRLCAAPLDERVESLERARAHALGIATATAGGSSA